MSDLDTTALAAFERAGDYDAVIVGVRAAFAADPRGALTDPWLAGWLGRRYRQVFLWSAAQDPEVVAGAERLPGLRLLDDRSLRLRLFQRYFRAEDPAEAAVEMPPPGEPALGDVTLVFCPGLLTGLLPQLAFAQVFPRIEARYGLPIRCVDAHPVRGCEANVADVLDVVERGLGQRSDNSPVPVDAPEPVGDFVLWGYSKGAPDALTALVCHPELARRCRAFVSWAGVSRGSYVADDIFPRIESLPIPANPFDTWFGAVLRRLAPVVRLDNVTHRSTEYDVLGAVRDLTTGERRRFLLEHGADLDAMGVPCVSFSGATRLHEVPYFQSTGYLDLAKRDPDNDMQLTQEQARLPLPMSVHLATFHAHHWDLSYDAFPRGQRLGSPNLEHGFARYAAVEAVVLTLAELGVLGPR